MPSKSSSPRPARKGPLPVTILSGFLGAGKTTLLKRLLENSNGLRIGALVNDVSAVNIDGALVTKLDQAKQVVQLENGCICCTLRDSLMNSLLEMAQDSTLDYCIVESTGVSEPRPVAETFTFTLGEAQDKDGNPIGDVPLSKFVRLDTCVTVVDAANFPATLSSRENARQKFGEQGDEADRDIAEILADQLEFADVVIVNKCDLIDEAQAKKVHGAVRAFNVGARIIQATRSNVAFTDVIGTNRFDLEKAVGDTRWLAEIRGNASKSELEEFGISSIVYRRRRPFHPKRFAAVAVQLARLGNSLLRSKGFVWLATKNEGYGEWSQTGVVWSLVPGGRWMIATPREEWPSTDPGFVKKVEADMVDDPKIGDRRQEMVFIGQGLKEKEIVDLLDGCLLNDEEMKDESKWSEMTDPFDEWDFTSSDDEDEEECDDEACEDQACENGVKEIADKTAVVDTSGKNENGVDGGPAVSGEAEEKKTIGDGVVGVEAKEKKSESPQQDAEENGKTQEKVMNDRVAKDQSKKEATTESVLGKRQADEVEATMKEGEKIETKRVKC